jgi:hypothetical protein
LEKECFMNDHLNDLRAALQDGIGAKAISFDVMDATEVLGHPEVALAVDLQSHRAYVMTYGDQVPKHNPGRAQFLADACATLTRRWGTLVAPIAGVAAGTYWGSPSQRGVAAFPLELLDRPLRLPDNS